MFFALDKFSFFRKSWSKPGLSEEAWRAGGGWYPEDAESVVSRIYIFRPPGSLQATQP